VKAAVPTHSTFHCSLLLSSYNPVHKHARQVFFPYYHTLFIFLFIPDLFYRFLLYIYIYITNLPSLLQVFFSVFLLYIFHSLPPHSLTISNPAVAACALVLLVWMGYSRHCRWNDTACLSAHYSPWFMKQFDAT